MYADVYKRQAYISRYWFPKRSISPRQEMNQPCMLPLMQRLSLIHILYESLAEVGTDGEHGGGIEMANKIVREIIHAKGIDTVSYTHLFLAFHRKSNGID